MSEDAAMRSGIRHLLASQVRTGLSVKEIHALIGLLYEELGTMEEEEELAEVKESLSECRRCGGMNLHKDQDAVGWVRVSCSSCGHDYNVATRHPIEEIARP